jgi:hypothetical protein
MEGYGDFKLGQAIRTVKSAEELELLAKEEAALQGMLDRQSETGRGYRMEMNVEEFKQ